MADETPTRISEEEAELLVEYLKTLENVKQTRQAISELSSEELATLEASSAVSTLTADQEERIRKAVDQQRNSLELSLASSERLLRDAESRRDAAEGTKDELKAQAQLLDAQIQREKNLAKTKNSGTAEYLQILEKIQKLEDKRADIADKIDQKYDDIQLNLRKAYKEAAKLSSSMVQIEKPGEAVLGNVKAMGGALAEAGKAKLFKSFPQLKALAGPVGAAIGPIIDLTKAMIELAVNITNASNQFQKLTGVGSQFADTVMLGFEETRQFGGSLEELSASAVELSQNFTDFTLINADVAKSLAVSSTMLGKLGVSASDFAKGIQLSTKALGMTVSEAEGLQRRLAATAMDIGVAPQQMAAEFAAAGPSLSKFGRDAEQVFKQLAVTSKSTGIEIQRLLQITEEFDTFEGAATAAGKLNAALGGNFVNAMDLVTETDPTKRFEMIRDSVLDAGLAFDEMDYYQKKMIASSMGLKDTNELALALSGNSELLGNEMGKTSAEIEAMALRAHEVQSIQEQLNLLFADMVPILEPAIGMLRDLVKFLVENKKAVQLFTVALSIMGAALLVTTAPISLLVAALGTLAYFLFREQFASSFLDGLFKIGNGFEHIGEMATSILSPLMKMKDIMGDLGMDMFKDKSIKVGAKMTTESLEGVGDASAKTASKMKAVTPVMATSNTVSNAINNNASSNTYSNSTVNNNGSGGGKTEIEINLAKGVGDFLEAKIKNVVGKSALSAITGG